MAQKNLGAAPSGATDADTVGARDAAIAASQLVQINAQTGTTYTLVLADGGKAVEVTNAAAIVVTVPTNATVAFPIGTVIEIAQLGAGQITITPASGVTIQSAGSLTKTRVTLSAASLRKRATDTWLLVGDLA